MVRTDLQEKLEELLGSRNVYFQPPEAFKRNFPCFQYSLDRFDTRYADNRAYRTKKRYSITYFDHDPDSTMPDRMMENFPYCYFERCYRTGTLNCWVFNIYI